MITAVKRVPGEEMLDNCLTKQGASAEKLLAVMEKGEYELPEVLDV